MIRLIAIPGFAIAIATSAQAVTPAPIAQPASVIIQVREGCGLGMIMVNGVCVARSTIRQERRDYYGTGGYSGYGAGTGIAAAGAVATGAYVSGSVAATYPSNAPSFVSESVVLPPGQSATVIDPDTGRRCTISTSGYHWCWRP